MKKSVPGLVHVLTGNGKGKTTSSMGMAIRALGRGWKVRIIQLFKRDTGEKNIFDQLGVAYYQFKPLHPYFKKYEKKHLEDLQKELVSFWNQATKNLDNEDLLVVDEIGPALNSGLFPEKKLLRFLAEKPFELEVVLTGRDVPSSVRDQADYCAEIVLKKHPYLKGVLARKGIEF